MNKVISLRLSEEERAILEQASKEAPDRSAAARALIRDGWTFLILKKYREGKLSTGQAARALDSTISEFIDVLGDLGVRTPIEYEDYLDSEEALNELWEDADG